MFFGMGHVGRQGVAAKVVPGVGTGLALNLNFTAGVLDPLVSFTRASTATYFDTVGTMQVAATNAPRWDSDPVTHALRGLLMEDTRTNSIPNSTMVGASVGVLPTGWTTATGTGVAASIVATGAESGIAYVDIRYVGTAIAGQVNVVFEAANAIAALTGQTWATSYYARIVAGTQTNVSSICIGEGENTAAGGAVTGANNPIGPITAAPLATQRYSHTRTLSGGGTVGAFAPYLVVFMQAGAVDMTLRLGAPQCEQSVFTTSFIPTTSVAVTRAPDSCLVLPANMGWFTAPGGSWQAEFTPVMQPVGSTAARVIGRPGAAGISPMYLNSSSQFGQYDGAGFTTAYGTSFTNTVRAASTWTAGTAKLCAGGGAVTTSAAMATGYGAFTAAGVAFMIPSTNVDENMTGYLRAVRYWPRILTDAEMQAVTA